MNVSSFFVRTLPFRRAALCWLLLFSAGFSVRAIAVTTVARTWDEEILSAIRLDTPHPPVHARNLFHLSVAMYDAWAAYDPAATGYLFREKHTSANLAAARNQAISHAAYRILKERYALSRSAATTLAALDARMAALGYDKNNVSLDTSTPAGLGNSVAALVSSFFIADGANQTGAYMDNTGYVPVNDPLVTGFVGSNATNVNRWQPLAIANALDQNGNPVGPIQKFLGAQWKGVRAFALAREDSTLPWIDPGPPPQLAGSGDASFKSLIVEILNYSSQMTPDDGVFINTSPGTFGNNTLGANDGLGHPLNPVTGFPYASNVLKRGDFARVLAEFWADGPSSETPPGHWNVLANAVADNPAFQKRIGGTGPVVNDLEWDVKIYFAINGALHDAACAAWSLKRQYDGWRPVAAVRYMAQLGQSTDPAGASYHPFGLPLVPGLIELVTSATAQTGQRHQGLTPGFVAIHVWPGQPANVSTQHSGVKWVHAIGWFPYQKNTFVTPAFPGYISGHSTFSRAAAEIMTAMTGSSFFPGGLQTASFAPNSYLTFEQGPSQTVQLQWATYYDAADQAGLSRLWGGIHVSLDDVTGRVVGSQCGKSAWDLARQYFDSTIVQSPFAMTIRQGDPGQCVLRCQALRGFYYKLQSTADLSIPFMDDPLGFVQALDAYVVRTDTLDQPKRFYRFVRSPN